MKFKRSSKDGSMRSIAVVGLGSALALIGAVYAASSANKAWLPDGLQIYGGLFSTQFLDASLLPAGYL